MHSGSDIIRPPWEAQDAFLQVAKGCSHGSRDGREFCTFCKNCSFRPSPMVEMEADVRELKARWAFLRPHFLPGADAFVLSCDRLVEIAERICRELPGVRSIGGCARIDNLKNKTVGSSGLRTRLAAPTSASAARAVATICSCACIKARNQARWRASCAGSRRQACPAS